MDVVAAILDGPRAQGAFVIRTQMVAPWAMRIEDEAALTVVVVLDGPCVLQHPALVGPVDLERGDLIVVRGDEPYVLGDAADTAPRFRVLPGNRPVTMAGGEVGSSMNLGIRTWGTPDDGRRTTRILTGIYAEAGEASRRLLDAIDPVVVRRSSEAGGAAYAEWLAAESLREAPGQSVVLDRLLDLVLVDTLRHHFAVHPERAPGWYKALDDDVIGPAMRAVHADPSHPWSVVGLAATANLSRAAFARRFREVVGEPPMTYVRRWRLSLAADLLSDPAMTVRRAAGLVGYDSAFTFSSAFKAEFGLSPSASRRATRSDSNHATSE